MGGDGGSIAQRSEMVKTKKKEITEVDPGQLNYQMATTCALSQMPLAKPIVICDLGNLYNRDSVVTFLMEKKNTAYEFKHIRSLKDVYGTNPHFLDERRGSDESVVTPICCPITSYMFDRHRNFYYLKPCCCIVSEQALKQMGRSKCPSCETIINAGESDDEFAIFLPILPNQEVKDRLRARLLGIRQIERQEKKEKKALMKNRSAAIESHVPSCVTTIAPIKQTLATKQTGSFLDSVKFDIKTKAEERLERKKLRQLERAGEDNKTAADGVDERAAEDPRFRSKAFASIFMKRGLDDHSNRQEFVSGISTKAISQMSYL